MSRNLSREPGADELRMRAILRTRGVGPDATPPLPAVPPKPTARPRDWLDDILDSGPTPGPAIKKKPAEPKAQAPDRAPAFAPQPDYYPQPHMPAALTHAPGRAQAALSHGTRRFLYNASAAGVGWSLGLYDQFASVIADCGRSSIGGAIVLGVGATLLIAHVWDRRTRHWWPGIAWGARIPLATAVVALALWAPAAS
ncbi:hypothetical protein [Streptomyces adelaidensis]|uniref:hypothetical protein n=1 Tax=Streptomyces adelaidensis TaxID=2796465 RepID=UPI0019030BBE|nr:hypothetical protein [Streptomyces adelaidensis]